jgi:hypothetical protein
MHEDPEVMTKVCHKSFQTQLGISSTGKVHEITYLAVDGLYRTHCGVSFIRKDDLLMGTPDQITCKTCANNWILIDTGPVGAA